MLSATHNYRIFGLRLEKIQLKPLIQLLFSKLVEKNPKAITPIHFIQQIRGQCYFCYHLISRAFAASAQKQKEPLH